MKRILAIIIAMTFVLSAGADAQPKGAFQLGVGTASVYGAPVMGLSWDVFTLHAGGMLFPSPWATLIADFSYGMPHDYEMKYDDDTNKLTAKSAYLDLMAGACKHFTDGGFLYASVGLAVAWSGLEFSDSDSDLDIETGLGIVVGAGIQVPIKNTFMGFAGFRQRYVSTDLIDDDMTASMNAGGFELNAGVAWTFGD